MKYILYTAFFFCFVNLTSCGEDREIVSETEETKPASLPVLAPVSPPAYTTPLPASNNTVGSTAMPRLNPAHGQPGHRCDLAVGALLPIGTPQNVKSGAPVLPVLNPTIQTIPAIQTNTQTPIAGTGINPAHGQPGHRCDIAVGATLPKGPAQSVNTITPASPLITPPIQNIPIIQSQANTTVVAAGLNPAHGQPGHRCDIAVGKPLNSAPQNNLIK